MSGTLIGNAIALVCNCSDKHQSQWVLKFAPKGLKAQVLRSTLDIPHVVVCRWQRRSFQVVRGINSIALQTNHVSEFKQCEDFYKELFPGCVGGPCNQDANILTRFSCG